MKKVEGFGHSDCMLKTMAVDTKTRHHIWVLSKFWRLSTFAIKVQLETNFAMRSLYPKDYFLQ